MQPLYNTFSRISEHIPTTRKQLYINLKRNSVTVFQIVSATLLGLAGIALVSICEIPSQISPSSSPSETSIISTSRNINTPAKACLITGSALTVLGSSLMVGSVIQTVRALRVITTKIPRSQKRLRKRFKLIYNLALEIFGETLGIGSTLISYVCYMQTDNNVPFCSQSSTLAILSGLTGMAQGTILIIIICRKHDGLCVNPKKIKVKITVHAINSAVALRMLEPDLLTESELLSIQASCPTPQRLLNTELCGKTPSSSEESIAMIIPFFKENNLLECD
ncbi:hypothetical protein CLAVI_000416 [Candidatus Clavichlamydia salmonicola]|uniref:hypothetical protein n=1 Tax=Candidatus Clavichlamydia salmonicola TaxID=469812 RepID=UPI00189120B9|nr:hypothetical protein [Candidatus Clavichlamydia salmonicola]MBF5050797.1 hypothetical protein [Candidatus Clavichlamydia salmonicola]